MLLRIAPQKQIAVSEKKDTKKTELITSAGFKNNTYIFPQG